MYLNGRVGQVLGPFSAGVDLLAKNGIIMTAVAQNTNSETIELTKLGIQADQGTIITINGADIKVGKTGIYELDETVAIRSLIFPNGASSNVIVDFVY